mmetsp:Transcript_45900/g.82653  ORF Transcript_45900/g.82653 Transcript_45900/m.82653 type:complete len:335 (+) Transcript_45900:646-1650(+)
MVGSDARTFLVIHILAEGVCEQMHLDSQSQKSPVFKTEHAAERLPCANVVDILETEDIQIEVTDVDHWHVLLLFLFDLFLLGLLLLLLSLSLLLRFGLLLLDLICLPLRLLCFPAVQLLAPGSVFLHEPFRWGDVFHSRSQLALKLPILEVRFCLFLFGPAEADLVKTFRLLREREVGKAGAQVCTEQIREFRSSERLLLLLCREFGNWLCFLFHCFILLLLFFLFLLFLYGCRSSTRRSFAVSFLAVFVGYAVLFRSLSCCLCLLSFLVRLPLLFQVRGQWELFPFEEFHCIWKHVVEGCVFLCAELGIEELATGTFLRQDIVRSSCRLLLGT